MQIRYVGPHKSIEIAATRQVVARGDTVDVDQKVARQLVKQAAWEKAPVKKTEDKETHDG